MFLCVYWIKWDTRLMTYSQDSQIHNQMRQGFQELNIRQVAELVGEERLYLSTRTHV
jgi:hypothetical protein